MATATNGPSAPAQRDSRGRFKAGQSGNSSGRPKRAGLFDEQITAYMEEAEEGAVGTRLERLMASLFKEAENGNVMAARELLDRMYGKPRQAVDISGDLPTTFAALAAQVHKEQRNGHVDGDSSS